MLKCDAKYDQIDRFFKFNYTNNNAISLIKWIVKRIIWFSSEEIMMS